MDYSQKAELHCHSNCGVRLFYAPFLYDSTLTEAQIIDRCMELNIRILAITDHDSLASYEVAKDIISSRNLPILLIPSCEISTRKGHILAYGITKKIPSGLTPKETIDQIHAQGGLAVAAHPYSWFKSLKNRIFKLDLDAIEVFNSFSPFHINNRASNAAQKIGKPGVAGSDAHASSEIGRSSSLFSPTINSVPEFLHSLKNGHFRIQTSYTPFFPMVKTSLLDNFRIQPRNLLLLALLAIIGAPAA